VPVRKGEIPIEKGFIREFREKRPLYVEPAIPIGGGGSQGLRQCRRITLVGQMKDRRAARSLPKNPPFHLQTVDSIVILIAWAFQASVFGECPVKFHSCKKLIPLLPAGSTFCVLMARRGFPPLRVALRP
jgi:hypothetical protein